MVAKSKKKVTYEKAWYMVAATRIVLGFYFLWAFFDKTFGLGFATSPEKSWLSGNSPTSGYLGGVAASGGPFADLFGSMAGNPFVDLLFMAGLLGIGAALVLGIGLRVAAVTGTILMLMMWMAALPLKNNPILDDHIVYAMAFWIFALGARKWSLFDRWYEQPEVKRNPWLW